MEETNAPSRLMARVEATGGEISPEILEACRRGDREALRELYEAYKDRVYSIAFYFFHADHDAAGEVTQQVFLKVMSQIARFRGEASFSTWLYRLVVNACVDAPRGRRADVVGRTRHAGHAGGKVRCPRRDARGARSPPRCSGRLRRYEASRRHPAAAFDDLSYRTWRLR